MTERRYISLGLPLSLCLLSLVLLLLVIPSTLQANSSTLYVAPVVTAAGQLLAMQASKKRSMRTATDVR
ncbi:hypothetical protein ACFLWA_09665 [Chloroflexota bacterium]